MSIQFYTVPEAAAILRVSRVTIYRRIESGAMPCVKVGSRALIPASYLQSLADTALGNEKGANHV